MKVIWGLIAGRKKPDIRLLLLVACAVLILGSWLVVGIQLEMDYNTTVREIQFENDNLAKVFEEHIRRIIGGIDDSLMILKKEYEREGAIPPVTNHIFTRANSEQFVNHMIISDYDGNVLASSAVKIAQDLNVADHEYFAVHRGVAPDRLYIGKLITERISGKMMIPISRRINNPDGSFGGVVAALITINYFDDFFRQMKLGDEKIAMVADVNGFTGLRISSYPISAGLDGERQNLFRRIEQQTENSFIAEYVADEQRRFVSYRVIPDYHLFVNVGTLVDQRLAAYYQHRRWYGAAALFFNLIVMGSGILLTRKIGRLFKAQRELAISEERYRTIFEAANDGIYVHDAKTGEILDLNSKACDFYGYKRDELLSGELGFLGTEEPPYTGVEAKQWIHRAAAGEPQLFKWRNRDKNGHDVWMEVSLKRTTIGDENRILAIVRDISERKVQQEQIQRAAYYDKLTGLPNRTYLKDALELEQKMARQGKAAGAVIFVDMDDLKMVNDTFGHSCGDDVITIAGGCLSAAAGEESIVARLGGDEFIIMIPNQSDREQIARIAENLVTQLGRNYELAGASVFMSASVGIALYPADGSIADELIKKADLAMYAAKESGKNAWRFYDDFMEKGNREKMLLKNALRMAIENRELSLRYQPIMPTSEGGVISFEVLLRWTSAVYGPVLPAQFIPLAEESETIRRIGQWVLKEAVLFIRKLSDMGKGAVRVSINVSPRQLVADDFVMLVHNAIANAGVNPNQLGIEVTENTLIASLTDSTHKLNKLRQIGVHLSMDDFGTGYSSLTYLRTLPVETIKIDKSFIDEIASNEAQMRFVQGILNLAHAQGLTVVAEGVETKAQLDKLVLCKCDFIQGYIFSQPLLESEAIHFLNAHC